MSKLCVQCDTVGFVSHDAVVLVGAAVVIEYRCSRCGFSWRALLDPATDSEEYERAISAAGYFKSAANA